MLGSTVFDKTQYIQVESHLPAMQRNGGSLCTSFVLEESHQSSEAKHVACFNSPREMNRYLNSCFESRLFWQVSRFYEVDDLLMINTL